LEFFFNNEVPQSFGLLFSIFKFCFILTKKCLAKFFIN
jgi:hypothetical protein